MNEAKFKTAINQHIKKLCPDTYIWCIADKFTAGIPDCYYSNKSDLWIEFKYGDKSYGITPLQQKWLVDQHNRGRYVAAIHGYDDYANLYIINDADKLEIVATFNSKKDIAKWIISRTSTP